MYARGMTVREIRGFLAEMYGAEVTPDFIRTVRDALLFCNSSRSPLKP